MPSKADSGQTGSGALRSFIRRSSFGFFLATVLACAKDPLKPPTGPPPFAFNTVDFSPTWSSDGRLIAYRRVYPSSDGPSGIYVISKWGGKPTFVTGASFLWPADLRFSPDGSQLAAVIDLQLAIIDVSTGAVSMPMYTDNVVRFPDWSPDGRFIVYSRNAIVSGEPWDSAGLHVFEPSTGRDRPIINSGQVVLGRAPRWSPGGEWIAFITTSPNEVGIVSPDGAERRALFQGQCLERDLRWYRRRLTGLDGIVAGDGCGGGFFFIDLATAIARPFRPLGPYDEFSPDGSEFVTIGLQQPDSLGLLFTQSVDDFSGATRFQVTQYTPPPANSIQVSQPSEGIVSRLAVR